MNAQRGTSTLLINEYPLQVLPSLAVALGLNAAIILQQMHFWLDRSKHVREGKTWIYNTYDDWQKQFPFWSLNTIKRAIHHLEQLGILVSTARFNRNPIDKSKWYTIDHERLNDWLKNTTTQNESSTTQNESSIGPKWAVDDPKWADSHRDLSETISETSSTKEGQGSAPAPEMSKGFFMPREYVPTPLLIEQMTRDCPDIDVPHAIKKCMVTTFRRSILDPAFTLQKFCLEEEDKARDLHRRYPGRAPIVHERVSQGTSDNIRTYERLRARKFTSQPEEHPYGTDRGRLLSRHAGSDHPGRPVSRFSVRNTDGQLLGDPTTRAVSG